MKVKYILFVLLFSSMTAVGQTTSTDEKDSYSRNSFWTETVFNGAIKNKWKWQLDYQYRRSSDASYVPDASGNLFKNSFAHVYRPWIHYQLNQDVRLSLSPIGFWESWSAASESGGQRKIEPEFRICPQITLTNKIGRVTFDQRYRYEFRMFGTKVVDTRSSEFGYGQGMEFHDAGRKMRMRLFTRFLIPLNNKKLEANTFYLVGWNELFLGVGKNTADNKIWDQNRSFLLVGYKPAMNFPMRFELGYGRIYSNKFSSSVSNGQIVQTVNRIEQNNILQVYVIFENFNKLFAKKEVKTN